LPIAADAQPGRLIAMLTGLAGSMMEESMIVRGAR
jgi:hypothetical protein